MALYQKILIKARPIVTVCSWRPYLNDGIYFRGGRFSFVQAVPQRLLFFLSILFFACSPVPLTTVPLDCSV